MEATARRATILCTLLLTAPALAQAQAPQAGAPFQLNTIEQAYLDQVLDKWEQESSKVTTFQCPFDLHVYNIYSPAPDKAYKYESGKISYQKPDKGSFQVEKQQVWQWDPRTPGDTSSPTGKYVESKADALGQHWVCDGEAMYEYKHDDKKLVVRTIPPEMRGQGIVDGPLPFIFGAPAAKLKERYWMRIDPRAPEGMVRLVAVPKTQRDAANYRSVEVMLDRQKLMPTAIQINVPDGSRETYVFDVSQMTVNSRVTQLWNQLFAKPSTPWGWTRVEDDAAAAPPAQAQVPQTAPR
ncbi:hypothetical protein Pla175_48140 [Pirellulimonas nuda]|uniref:Uncharacterized protein n=1 Tax=Pirellulimonas nuda TaxID=2528009 RepID=A0A518DIY1_9BACT|nr:hypothetical protein [Pirellulimonas nuda]QDU91392.1 hypothetical protein Pla175_48140 [Pirellulimonas nuda]